MEEKEGNERTRRSSSLPRESLFTATTISFPGTIRASTLYDAMCHAITERNKYIAYTYIIRRLIIRTCTASTAPYHTRRAFKDIVELELTERG
ncbi:hypothetical protein WN48_09647 [Eufriesea mexicana]|uniref:Uncharacterized protein n=1 Tax=Eufriesea mexicana TaxID=516756 RepID=A0A310S728_9HYME|nr:hypothetical protein WN48_09647 [Eufriesea mexicana]